MVFLTLLLYQGVAAVECSDFKEKKILLKNIL